MKKACSRPNPSSCKNLPRNNIRCLVTVAGRKLNVEDIILAEELFTEILEECSQFVTRGGEPFPSVGEFVRAQVLWCTVATEEKCDSRITALYSGLVQVQQRAAEKWKDVGQPAKPLLLCTINTLLKLESGISGAHSMDEVGLGAFGQYKTLPGLDCTFPGFVRKLKAILGIILNKYTLANTLWGIAACLCGSVCPSDSISHAAVMKV